MNFSTYLDKQSIDHLLPPLHWDCLSVMQKEGRMACRPMLGMAINSFVYAQVTVACLPDADQFSAMGSPVLVFTATEPRPE